MKKQEKKTNEKQSFLFDVLKRYDHYIGTINVKISILMSFLVAILVGFGVRINSSNLFQVDCSVINLLIFFSSLIAILLSLISLIELLKAVFPNTNSPNDYKSLIFFGDVVKYNKNPEEYAKKIKESIFELLIDDLSKQTYIVASILNEKLKLLKRAIKIICFGVIPSLGLYIFFFFLKGSN